MLILLVGLLAILWVARPSKTFRKHYLGNVDLTHSSNSITYWLRKWCSERLVDLTKGYQQRWSTRNQTLHPVTPPWVLLFLGHVHFILCNGSLKTKYNENFIGIWASPWGKQQLLSWSVSELVVFLLTVKFLHLYLYVSTRGPMHKDV